MVPRFQFPFDAPPPQSVGEVLLESAETLEIKLFRRSEGNVTVAIELRAVVGADLFADDDDVDGDTLTQSRKSQEGLAYARRLLCAFAAAGKAGNA
jgi:hypothetical protein